MIFCLLFVAIHLGNLRQKEAALSDRKGNALAGLLKIPEEDKRAQRSGEELKL